MVATGRGFADAWNPPMPDGWNTKRYWVDMRAGSEIELPGAIRFRLTIDKINEANVMRLAYTYAGAQHEFVAEMGIPLDLTSLTGYPCVLIPRTIRSAHDDLPPAVLLEFGQVMA